MEAKNKLGVWLAVSVAAGTLMIQTGCSGRGRHNTNHLSKAQLRMNQIRSATDWEMAESAFLAGDFERAEEKLRRSISLNPRVAKSHELLGRVNLEKGNLELARESLLRATVLDPERAEPRYFLGVLEERFRQPDAALEHYQLASELDETNAAYAVAVVEVLVDLDQIEEARAFLDEREESFAYNAGLRQTRGHLAMLEGEAEQAVAMFREASLLSPDDQGLQEDLGRALLDAGDAPAAAHVFESLLADRDYEERRDIRRLLADCYAQVDRLMEARSLLLDVVADEQGAENADVWRELGAIAYEISDFRTVGRAGRRLMALAPQDPEGYVFRAAWLSRDFKHDQALEVLNEGASRGALDADALVMRGVFLAKLGRDSEARKSFVLALEEDPKHELASTLLGQPASGTITIFTETD